MKQLSRSFFLRQNWYKEIYALKYYVTNWKQNWKNPNKKPRKTTQNWQKEQLLNTLTSSLQKSKTQKHQQQEKTSKSKTQNDNKHNDNSSNSNIKKPHLNKLKHNADTTPPPLQIQNDTLQNSAKGVPA